MLPKKITAPFFTKIAFFMKEEKKNKTNLGFNKSIMNSLFFISNYKANIPFQNTRNQDSTEETQQYVNSGINKMLSEEIYTNLQLEMEKNANYKDCELTLTKLAATLKVHPNYLSQAINQNEGENFYNYINAMRIKAFIKIVSNPENKQYTLLSLAFDCGFNSKSTFNKYFKKQTGYTPTTFKNKLLVA